MELPSLIHETDEGDSTNQPDLNKSPSFKQDPVSPDLRKHLHIKSEQRRRGRIIDGFQKLRGLIPSVKPQTDSKAQVLSKASEYIETLQHENSVLSTDLESVKGYASQLHNQLIRMNVTPSVPPPQLHGGHATQHHPQLHYPANMGTLPPPFPYSHLEHSRIPYPGPSLPPPPHMGVPHFQPYTRGPSDPPLNMSPARNPSDELTYLGTSSNAESPNAPRRSESNEGYAPKRT
ncbi:hypothetical protein OGAPHI_005942 [Ogataea philodendri]|uniref:BHLH domain-containing protein n=1 Tax=Ogataea philodendri TaxID=1378263 RepID=A0A9P8NYG5_9ASCO|nr:uncharacterized protein OGAPHI_005942 [Ogataea philodendri]KAH3661764.1 hypothetical protein OGAPHI_005942 [Ogataea philodendri]